MDDQNINYLTWLEQEIAKNDHKLFTAKGLINRGYVQGRLNGLQSAMEEYKRSHFNDGR